MTNGSECSPVVVAIFVAIGYAVMPLHHWTGYNGDHGFSPALFILHTGQR